MQLGVVISYSLYSKIQEKDFLWNTPHIVWSSAKLIQQDVNAEPAVGLYGAFMYKYSPYRSKLVYGCFFSFISWGLFTSKFCNLVPRIG